LFLVGVVGAIIASISVVFNTFLFCILVRNRRYRSSSLIYLTFLALADTFLSAAYILLFPVNIYMDYFASEFLASAWWSYMRIIITTSHVFISASAFLIVAAAFERYITISKIRNQFARHHRFAISAGALVFALIAKLPMYFELEVVPNGNCTGVTSLTAIVSEFSETEPYKTVYKFWFRSIITIVLPFILCFTLNFGIIRRLRIQHQGAKLFRFATSEHRKNIRSATLMLVFVTCTYLGSNLLNVIVYTWELIDKVDLNIFH
ncbi:7 transmembrane receptor, partial [Oesophagostomum dentatum]